MYIDKLVDLVTEYNNAYHCTIKMSPADVKLRTWLDSDVENKEKDGNLSLVLV